MDYIIPKLEKEKEIIEGVRNVLDGKVDEFSFALVPCMSFQLLLKNNFEYFKHEAFDISGWKIDFAWYFYLEDKKLKTVGSMFYGDVRISLEKI